MLAIHEPQNLSLTLAPATGPLYSCVFHAASGKVYEDGWILRKLKSLDPGSREEEASHLHDLVLWTVKLARCYMHNSTRGQVSSRRRTCTCGALAILGDALVVYVGKNRRMTRDTCTIAL